MTSFYNLYCLENMQYINTRKHKFLHLIVRILKHIKEMKSHYKYVKRLIYDKKNAI